MNRSSQRRDAFTLVELLVVIGIIAILISIILPALSAARRQANLIKCSANLRQMYQGASLHAHDHRGYLPLAGHLQLEGSIYAWSMDAVSINVGDRERKRYTYAWASGSTYVIAPFPAGTASSGDLAFVGPRLLGTATTRTDDVLVEFDLAARSSKIIGPIGESGGWGLAGFGPTL